MSRAAIYVRISRDPDHEGLGVARQEADCRALVERKGWEVAEVLVDDDVSAYSGKPRPGYQRLCELVKNADATAVVVWHPDRLHRSPRELEDFIDLIEATGATVATVTAGDYDLATPEGRLTARIVGSVARKESEDKSRRLRRKHLELAELGQVSGGGWRPFGFEDDRVTIRPDEAALVREASAAILAGRSIRGLCAEWNALGHRTSTGLPWPPFSLRRLLVSPRIAGLREHRGAIAGEAVWPAIVDRVTWERVRAHLSDPARRLNEGARRYLLTGFAVCGREGCGARLVARPREDKRRCYICASGPGFNGCGKIRVLAEPFEDHVVGRIIDVIEQPGLLARLEGTSRASDDDAELVAEIALDEERLAQLARDHYVDGVIGRTQFLAASQGLEHHAAALRRRLGHQQRHGVLAALVAHPEPLSARWEAMALDEQRAAVSAIVEAIVVGPAVRGRNYFDEARVSIRWRV